MALRIEGTDAFNYDAQKAAREKPESGRSMEENPKEGNPAIAKQPISQQLRTANNLRPGGDTIDLSISGQAQLRTQNSNPEFERRVQQQTTRERTRQEEQNQRQVKDNQEENQRQSREIRQTAIKSNEQRQESKIELESEQRAQIRLSDQIQREQERRTEEAKERSRPDDRSLDLLI